MSNPLPYLVRMLLFLVAVSGLGYWLFDDLLRVFLNTPTLNTVIAGVLLIGVFFVFRQVILLWPEVKWLRRYQHREPEAPPPPAGTINLLAPMAAMLGERQDKFRLSPTATRAVLDGIATRLDERRELARYMIGLLIFLGLLGTFWGLLQTISAVAEAINSLQVSAGDPLQMFAKLKGSIEGPLNGMATAFGASLFGLSGSLVLGFLELQASQAQGRFHIELEEWLARATSLSSANMPEPQSVPAYVEALLERNAEGIDGLLRTIQRIEDSRQGTAASNATLVERLAALAETMRAQQNLLARFTELSIELRGAVSRLSDRSMAAEADREALLGHQRNIEGYLSRLVEEGLRNRAALAEEMHGVVSRLSDRAADDSDREAVLAQQRSIEGQIARLAEATAQNDVSGQIARLAEESTRQRGELASELRATFARLADRSATEADRDAVLAQQRDIESQIARMAEDSARHRAELADQLRDAVSRFSDRSKGDADREAMLAQQLDIAAQIARLADESARHRGELADELRGAVDKLSDRSTTDADREAFQTHQRNVEAFLARLAEENVRNRAHLTDEIQGAVSRLSDRTAAEADREALAALQRSIESQLTRLIEDSTRNRTALAEELRTSIGRLSERIAEGDGETVVVHQRNIEAHLARLVEDSTINRTALADEMRSELRLLARTIALTRGTDQPPAAEG
jgi:gas vesicle protein